MLSLRVLNGVKRFASRAELEGLELSSVAKARWTGFLDHSSEAFAYLSRGKHLTRDHSARHCGCAVDCLRQERSHKRE